jgi:hypothetical protein
MKDEALNRAERQDRMARPKNLAKLEYGELAKLANMIDGAYKKTVSTLEKLSKEGRAVVAEMERRSGQSYSFLQNGVSHDDGGERRGRKAGGRGGKRGGRKAGGKKAAPAEFSDAQVEAILKDVLEEVPASGKGKNAGEIRKKLGREVRLVEMALARLSADGKVKTHEGSRGRFRPYLKA